MKRLPVTEKRETIPQGRKGEAGFTIVETVVAMALMLIVLGAIYGIWFGLQRTYSFTDEDLTAQEQARTAMNEIVELLRTARSPDPAPSEALNLVIVLATPNTLVCWTDVDRDPDHTLELVRFRVRTSTRTLYRDTSTNPDMWFTQAHSTRLVSSWVSNNADYPLFSYTGTNGSPLTTSPIWPFHVIDPTQIREVSIDLLVDMVIDKAPVRHHLFSVVQPRNLRQY